jgi:hypothetical protein
MLTFNHYRIDPNSWIDDLQAQVHMRELFPEMYMAEETKPKNLISKISYKAGSLTANTKNFFSKTETKTATLMAYWAADSLVGLMLMLTTTSSIAFVVAFAMIILHTYATFSIVSEVTK